MKMTEDQKMILDFLRLQVTAFSAQQISKQFGHESHNWADVRLRPLLKYGFLERESSGRIRAKREVDLTCDKNHAKRIIDTLLYRMKPCA